MDKIPYFIHDRLTLALITKVLPAHLVIVPFGRGMPYVGRCAEAHRTSLQKMANRFLVEDANENPMYRFCKGCRTGHVFDPAAVAQWDKIYDRTTDAQYYQLDPQLGEPT